MDKIKAYISLTKPRVIELLLVAAIPSMLQAERGELNLGLILLTLVGGWMGAAAANTFNMVADFDIDQKMRRTHRRPLAKNTVSKTEATVFAWTLTVGSVLWLGLLCNSWLASGFILLTIWFYIFVYTKWLKRKTWQNVIWGGAAGCMPVMVGWATVTDEYGGAFNAGWMSWGQALVLFLIIFFWTPPHTWALAMKYKEDYRKAGVPMLPVVADEKEVTRQIVWYTVGTVIVTLLIVPAASWIYLVAALASGAVFLWMAIRLHKGVKNGAKVKPMRLFIYSNNYLSVLFIGLSIDAVLGWEPLGRMLGWSATLF